MIEIPSFCRRPLGVHWGVHWASTGRPLGVHWGAQREATGRILGGGTCLYARLWPDLYFASLVHGQFLEETSSKALQRLSNIAYSFSFLCLGWARSVPRVALTKRKRPGVGYRTWKVKSTHFEKTRKTRFWKTLRKVLPTQVLHRNEKLSCRA